MGHAGYSSEELYEGCLKGSSESWNEAAQYVNAILCSSCWSHSEEDRNDLVNETLLYFLSRGLKEIDSPRAFKMLLRLKAKSLAIDRLRKSSGLPILQPVNSGEDDDPVTDDPFPPCHDNSEQRIFTRQALKICSAIVGSLKKECQEILPMYFKYKVGGEGVGQLAEDLGRPLNSLATTVHRCLKKLYSHPQIVRLREDMA